MNQYSISAFSNESPDFDLKIITPETILFSDLHEAIQKALEYDVLQMASFFVSNSEWEKLQEIALIEMDETQNIPLMNEVHLSEIFKKEGQHFIYLYDFFSERAFNLTLEQIKEVSESEFSITVSGTIPPQIDIDADGIENLLKAHSGDSNPFHEYEDKFDDDYRGDIDENDEQEFENIDDYEDL